MDWILISLLKYKYLLLFPLAVFQGSLASLVSGFLVYHGVFNFGLALLVLLLGDFIPDTVLYYVGYYGRENGVVKKYLLNNNFFSNHLNVIDNLWFKHGRKTMLLGKLSYGLAIPFLISAGSVKMPFKKFISYALVVSFFHYGLILFVGYFLGNSYASAGYYMNFISYGLAVITLGLFISYYFIVKYARKKIVNLAKAEEETEKIHGEIIFK